MSISIQHYFHKDRNVFILLLIIALISYSNTFENGYSFDDQYIYTENTLANNGLENVSKIFNHPSFNYNNALFGFRPITVLSFAIESQLFGINPFTSHVISLFLYCLSCFFFYLFLKQIFPQEPNWLALFTAIFFLIHPIHTEIVNNVKSRDELLMLFFGLVAAWFWIKKEKVWLFKPLGILLLICSILSKKSGLIFIGILPLATFFVSKGNWKRSIISFATMIVPLLLWKVILKGHKKSTGRRDYLSIENPLFGEEIPHEKAVIVLESIWFYAKSLLFPIRFSAYYGFNSIEVERFQLISLLGLLFLLVVAILAIYKLKQSRPITFGAIIVFAGLVPYINLFKPMVGIVAERFVTIASMGWAIVVCYGIYALIHRFNIQKLQMLCLTLFGLFFLSSVTLVRSRNSEWKTEKSILEAGLREYPNSVIMNKTLGSIYNRELGQIKELGKRRRKVLDIINVNENVVMCYPEKVSYTNIGNMKYTVLHDLPSALEAFHKAIELDPNFDHALSGLGHVYRDLGELKKSIKYFEHLLTINPNQKSVYNAVIAMFLEKDDIKSANRWNLVALKHFPKEKSFLTNQKKFENLLNQSSSADST